MQQASSARLARAFDLGPEQRNCCSYAAATESSASQARSRTSLQSPRAKAASAKSTVAANLAVRMGAAGRSGRRARCDIYGPSQPRLFGLTGQRPVTRDGKSPQPLNAHGVEVMSIGFLIDEEQPMVWRGSDGDAGSRSFSAIRNGVPSTISVVDMPPGTGDTQLTPLAASTGEWRSHRYHTLRTSRSSMRARASGCSRRSRSRCLASWRT